MAGAAIDGSSGWDGEFNDALAAPQGSTIMTWMYVQDPRHLGERVAPRRAAVEVQYQRVRSSNSWSACSMHIPAPRLLSGVCLEAPVMEAHV